MTHGPVVAITGGAGGIGLAVARRYGAEGAGVALLDRSTEALDTATSALEREGIEVLTIACDVTEPEAPQRVVHAIRERFGRLDVLVHCAGLTHVSPFRDTELSVYRRVMEVNFFAAVLHTKAALPLLLESRGHIVVLSSVAGFAPLLGRTGYCASKHALHGFFDTLRAELRDQGVHVMLVCPSFVQTDFAKAGLGGDGTTLSFERSTTGRPVTPDEVAEAVYHGVCKNRRLVVLPAMGRMAYWCSRLFPGCYERLMRRRFRIELDRLT
ncbi:MAG TPA: SDR family oxidoreductase [Candidatus Hydrogenedentes bacterium]|mgnify:CR=1 FL=1|nr:SDR family oxidoreductase [Candidatus Hydrogenedentota bacterium]